MNDYRADLHIHSVLSPCGDLDMSPLSIIRTAAGKGMDIIAVTDHNTTRHCRLSVELGEEYGIWVIPGVEVNTVEEVHCLAFFESMYETDLFQEYLDLHLPGLKNNPELFGYQVQVDRDDNILFEEEKMLWAGIRQSVYEISEKVNELGGVFVPSHVDRRKNSIFSQLGFMPPDLHPDGIEISRSSDPASFLLRHPELKRFTVLTNSDAHFVGDIAARYSIFHMESRNFREFKLAVKAQEGREVRLP